MSESEPSNKPPGLVCTFYSYKGGVGRSMALANVGVLMAAEGHRVLLVDWDLEAPGLEVFFQNAATLRGDPSATPGVVDLLEAQARGSRLDWRDCLLKAEFFGHSLDLISAGRRTDDYRPRVQQLNWDTLFRDHRIGNYIDSLREQWRAAYDFVLVDSRTGITDIGDICTVILPDVLVLLFVTNHQNVKGVKSVMARAVRARSKLPVNRGKLLAVPVPARDERYHDYDKSVEWQRIFADEFSELYREWLPKEVSPVDALNHVFLPYVSGWSFGERIPVIESERERADPTSLGAAYARMATLLSHRLDWSAIEAKTSTADAAGARVELSKAREEAREAQARLEQAQKAAALSKKRTRILAWVGALLLLLAAGGGYWWYVTHPTAGRLAARLGNSDPSVRADAARGLGHMEAAAVPYAPAIARLLGDPDESVRAAAVSTLDTIAIWDQQSVSRFAPDVASLLEDGDYWARYFAVDALGRMGDAGVRFAPAIARLLSDKESRVRGRAAGILGHMGKAAAEFAPQVWTLLNDQEAEVRAVAADALAKMGGYNKPPDEGPEPTKPDQPLPTRTKTGERYYVQVTWDPKSEKVLTCLSSLFNKELINARTSKEEEAIVRRKNGKRLVFADGESGKEWASSFAASIRECGAEASFTQPRQGRQSE